MTSTGPDEQPRRRDEELPRILIDPPTPHNAPIYLADYDPNWPALFEREATRILFKGPETKINLHVFSVGASEIDRMLLFRDWLRANPADRDAYLQVKRELAQQTWRHVEHYADAKTTIVEQIVARAQLARGETGGPNDIAPNRQASPD